MPKILMHNPVLSMQLIIHKPTCCLFSNPSLRRPARLGLSCLIILRGMALSPITAPFVFREGASLIMSETSAGAPSVHSPMNPAPILLETPDSSKGRLHTCEPAPSTQNLVSQLIHFRLRTILDLPDARAINRPVSDGQELCSY